MRALPDDKKAIVLAALLAGQGVNQIAERYNMPKSTVSRLKKAIPKEQLEQVGTQKGEHLADLIAANLEASMKARENILNQTKNVEWLNRQSAAELATLYGVAADKEFRVLEAIENAQPAEEPEDWPETVR